MNAHTLGPWVLKDQGGHSVLIEAAAPSICNINPLPGQEGTQIAEVFNAGPECGQDECRAEAMANARLIAAAPDLLEAVELALRYCDPKPDARAVRLRAALRVAIAKVHGE